MNPDSEPVFLLRQTPPATLVAEVLADNPSLTGKPWQPLSGGRSNRLWQVGSWVVKLFDREAASPLFPNDPAAEALALRHVAPSGLAPQLRAIGPDWLAYSHVPGVVWQADPAAVAEALGRLHQLPLVASLRAQPSGSAALAAQGAAIALHCRTALPPPPPDAGVPPVNNPCLIHGDAVPGNVIIGPQGVTLIDWQCPAIGDPAEDLAAFLSPAMQWLYRGKVLTAAEAAAFLQAYPDAETVARYHALAPAFHWRMAAHCLWKAERGATDYATALDLELAAI
ncbi:phosphotransferase family protein [Rhodobacter ferrooxidans]|uniref:Aminoglycoside phosphotransferase n=1 Tax=Rhodobacter ferrooxidans TaxID=371731 RepID=C8RX79_9RHOB|nr:phosphotransferase [Rhodobacter sp. SW2]EEW26604.1 aminoglycoside phosphotransferase [Rhodobacter sp. SW2]